MDLKTKFLASVLGQDGASALLKAASRSEELENALLPRTILAFLGIVARSDFEGEIPGIDNSYLEFKKNDKAYSGSITIGEEVYAFDQASLYHLAASIAVAIGADHERVDPSLRDLDIARLGKSIDLLAKARVVTNELLSKKTTQAPKVGAAAHPIAPIGEDVPAPPQTGVQKKPEAYGGDVKAPAGVPKPPGAPKLPRVQKSVLRVSKNQADLPCPVCSGLQFKLDTFVGCLCFQELSKGVKSLKNNDGYVLEFNADWGQDEILTLVESLRE